MLLHRFGGAFLFVKTSLGQLWDNYKMDSCPKIIDFVLKSVDFVLLQPISSYMQTLGNARFLRLKMKKGRNFKKWVYRRI